MFSTAARPEFAARLTGYEVMAEVFMPIRIKCHDKSLYEKQVTEAEGIIAILSSGSTASYTDRESKFRIFCGSI
jgi:hypothetical protein